MPDPDLRTRLERAIELLDDAQRQRLLDWAGVMHRQVENARAPGTSIGPIADFMRIETIERRPGIATYALTVVPELLNPHGVLHGGAVYTMVDYSMGAATMDAIAPDEICATIEIKISYLAGVRSGRLTCTTNVIKQGRSVVFLESHVTDASGRLVATASGSFAVIPMARNTKGAADG